MTNRTTAEQLNMVNSCEPATQCKNNNTENNQLYLLKFLFYYNYQLQLFYFLLVSSFLLKNLQVYQEMPALLCKVPRGVR